MITVGSVARATHAPKGDRPARRNTGTATVEPMAMGVMNGAESDKMEKFSPPEPEPEPGPGPEPEPEPEPQPQPETKPEPDLEMADVAEVVHIVHCIL